MAYSVILTKVNKVSMPFSQRIGLKIQENDTRLLPFVRSMHKNAAIQDLINKVVVYTSKGSYSYQSLGLYFERVNLETSKKDYYKIS